MHRESGQKILQACPIQGVIDVIGKKWALLIVAVVGSFGRLRYGAIMQELKGISPKTLADTLKELEKSGIVEREAFNEIPPRVEYSLTEDGLKLREAVVPMLQWAVDRSEEKDCIILKIALKPSKRSGGRDARVSIGRKGRVQRRKLRRGCFLMIQLSRPFCLPAWTTMSPANIAM